MEVKTKGNTTNLNFHMRRNHADVKLVGEDSTKAKKRKLQSQSDSEIEDLELVESLSPSLSDLSESNYSVSSVTSSTSEAQKVNKHIDIASSSSSSKSLMKSSVTRAVNKQLKLDATFAVQKSFQDGGTKASEITNALLFLIAKNNLPFDIVESEGFRVFMKKVSPLYSIPSRKTVTKLIEEKYDCLSTLVKQELSEVNDMCLTTDVWTESSNTKSFLGLTAHYLIGDDFKSVTIGVEELDDRHTAYYLGEKLLNLIEEWNIKKENVVAVVSDSAANIKKAITDAFGTEKHLPCFAHLLNLVPSKIIDSDEIVGSLCTKIKAIVKYFKKSVVAADKLRTVTDLKLQQSVETRWNSTYEMIVRFVLLADKVSLILLQCPTAPLMLSAPELQVAKEFIQLLNPFFEATQIVSKEKYFTGSKTIPVVKTIKNKLELCVTTTDSGIRLKTLLYDEFCKRFENIEHLFLLAAGTILDPRFKKLHFSNPIAYSSAVKKITGKIKMITENTVTPSEDPPVEVQNDPENFWSFHQAVVSSSKSKKSMNQDTNEMPQDLQFYLHQEVIEMTANPITYWRTYTNSPLATIARKYLSVIATSVPSERLFSKAGQIITDDRNRLSSLHLHQLLFLNSLSLQSWKL